MKNFKTFLQTNYHYTDYQIKVMDYCIKTCLSEISKFIFMGIFFSCFSAFHYYLYATLILWILRFCSGGLHCKTYIGCLLFSLTYLILCILLLPRFILSTFWTLVLLLMCIVTAYFIAPVPSIYRQHITSNRRKQYRTYLFIFLFIHTHIIPMCLDQLITHCLDVFDVQLCTCVRVHHGCLIDLLAIFGHCCLNSKELRADIG